MKRELQLLISLSLVALFTTFYCALSAQGNPKIELLSSFSTGVFDGSAAEISAYDPVTARVFFTNADANSIQILDVSDPLNPSSIGSIDMSTYGGGVNSVDVANEIVAVAVEAVDATMNGRVVFLDTNGNYLNDVEVGALPDMLTFSNDGTKVIIANEGEPNATYTVDPEGSVSIIDIAGGVEAAVVTNVSFSGLDGRKAQLLNKGVRIYGPNATVSQDLEPEYIALSSDDAIAYVALQENNALAVVDVNNAVLLDVLPMGYKDHNSGTPTLQQYVLNELVENWPELGTPDYLGGQPTVFLGGFSGLYFDPTQSDEENYVFYTVPDRGPNEAAVSKNNVIFPQVPTEPVPANLRPFKLPDYQARIAKFTLNISTGVVTLDDQILLKRIDGLDVERPITGISNFPGVDEIPVVPRRQFAEGETEYDAVDFVDTTTNIGYGEITPADLFGGDFEGILRDADGNFWLCDETRPSIYKFDSTGMMIDRFVPPGATEAYSQIIGFTIDVDHGERVLPGVYGNRRANRGFEAIALDTDNQIVYTFIQSPIENPDNSIRNNSDIIRILGVDLDGNPVAEYVYLLENNRDSNFSLKRTDKIGDAVYVGDGKFLVIERDSSVPEDGETGHKYIFEIDLKGATNIIELPIASKRMSTGPDDPTLEMLTADDLEMMGIAPVFKYKVLNLPSIGYHPSDKAEGIALLPNGAIAVLNDNDFGLAGAGVTDNSVLGVISFADNYGLDASNRDEAINIKQHPVFGMYQPDAIATFDHEGETFIITANEGDAREYEDAGYVEEDRVAGITLDMDVFPNAATLQDEAELGRIKNTLENGDLDGDEDFDRIFTFGARSFSILDQFGNLVYDSGDDFEQITAMELPNDFNSTNDENDSFDNRSDDKGPEPEAVEVFELDGRRFAMIGLERVGGIMFYDISDPRSPTFIEYFNNRDFGAPIDMTGDLGVEDIRFVPASDSPISQALILVANEVSGTVTIYSIGEVTDVEDFSTFEEAWKVFPNPVENIILTNIRSDYGVYNSLGQRIMFQANTNRIVVEKLPKGSYVIKDEKRTVSRLFVKN